MSQLIGHHISLVTENTHKLLIHYMAAAELLSLTSKGAAIAKKAGAERRPVREVAAELTDLTDEELDRLLNPVELTRGGIKS